MKKDTIKNQVLRKKSILKLYNWYRHLSFIKTKYYHLHIINSKYQVWENYLEPKRTELGRIELDSHKQLNGSFLKHFGYPKRTENRIGTRNIQNTIIKPKVLVIFRHEIIEISKIKIINPNILFMFRPK